ncbi:alcohol dehydrogenase [Neofusicoccum parvum]|uniref:Alcohol dehydrogenase n=1 Tax=Neofusicoccum parvum TaxID=310453 RepID=A0ACB5SGP4_9PEZI|nr:alcohol dehydrogenase [Neofusicoccum parvum]
MSQNKAAWIKGPRTKPLEVDHAPLWKPGPGELLIRNHAVALNKIEWKIQESEMLPIPYPNILGEDSAGTVEEVGEGVTRIQKGQRVIAFCHSIATGKAQNGAFQLYSVVPETLACPIPDSLPFENAAVLPLALSTAGVGLYGKEALALPYPSANPVRGGTILITGAASSVGCAAVQLARASGLDVIATASTRNHDMVKSLGATSVFDYNSPDAAKDIAAAIKAGSDFAGVFDTISSLDSFNQVGSILETVGPSKVAVVLPPPGQPGKNFEPAMVFASTIAAPPNDEVGDILWRKYIPQALEQGLIQAKPDLLIVGFGLEKIQEAMEQQKAGVSAMKIVVTL